MPIIHWHSLIEVFVCQGRVSISTGKSKIAARTSGQISGTLRSSEHSEMSGPEHAVPCQRARRYDAEFSDSATRARPASTPIGVCESTSRRMDRLSSRERFCLVELRSMAESGASISNKLSGAPPEQWMSC